MLKFKNYVELANELSSALIDKLDTAEIKAVFSASNISCSRYVYANGVKVRFSDYSNFHGSDLTIRINDAMKEVYFTMNFDESTGDCAEIYGEKDDFESNDMPEFHHVEISQADFDALVNEGFEFVLKE